MAGKTDVELDFNSDDYDGFYYTSDKQIKKMDDAFIISKIVEKYPDFVSSENENLLKQTFMVIARDSRFINQLLKEYDLTVSELFSIIYRNYSFIFNPCYISKIQKLVTRRSYARLARTPGHKISKRTRKTSRRR